METICGAKCADCTLRDHCGGCEATCGRPFGGPCVAAEYIKAHGKAAYESFKQGLKHEVNALLEENGLPATEALHELPGFFVNLEYPLPGGATAKFLDDRRVYLCAQIPLPGGERCAGAAADEGFILLCTYAAGGEEAQLICCKKRRSQIDRI